MTMNLADIILHAAASASIIIADSSFREAIHISLLDCGGTRSQLTILDVTTAAKALQKSPNEIIQVSF